MRRRNYIFGAAVLALAGGGFAVWAATSVAPGNPDTARVTSVIHLEPHLRGEIFAPPPSDAAPRLTAQQAIDTYAHKTHFKLPGNVTVQLGLFTLPIGDASDCGGGCSHATIANGIAYTWLNKLVYGLRAWECPAKSTKPAWQCTEWDFLDANTGEMIAGIGPPMGTI